MGIRLQWHVDKDNSQVKVFTEGSLEKHQEGIERSAYLPDMVKDVLQALTAHSAILDSETIWNVDGKPLPRHEMVAIAGGKEPITGEDIVSHVFDCLYVDGKSVNNQPYKARLALLDKVLQDSQHFKKVRSMPVIDRESFDKVCSELSGIVGSEGVIFKTEDSTYPLTGRTSSWAKWKVLFEIDVQIIGMRKVPASKPIEKKVTATEMEKLLPSLLEKSNTYVFRCAFLGKNGKLQPILSDKTYALGDFTLKWDEEHQIWKGIEGENAGWKMMEGFPQAKENAQAYGATYNFKPPEGTTVKLGDILTVAPVLMRIFEMEDRDGK